MEGGLEMNFTSAAERDTGGCEQGQQQACDSAPLETPEWC